MPLEKLTTTFGNLELYIERVTPGAPTQAAAKGAISVNLVEPNVYENVDGATTWRKFVGENNLLRWMVSPDGPYTSINDAILAAFTYAGLTGQAQVVLVAPGTYNETLVTMRNKVSVQGMPAGAFGAAVLNGRVLCPALPAGARLTWASVNINTTQVQPAFTYTGTPGVDTRLGLYNFVLSSAGKGILVTGGDGAQILALENVGTTDPNFTVDLTLDAVTGLVIAQKCVWAAGGSGVHVGTGASLFADGCFLGGTVTIDAGASQVILDTTQFTGPLVNNAVGAVLLKNVAFIGGASPTVTGAAAVTLAGTVSSAGGFPIFAVAPVRLAGDGPEFAYDASGDPPGTWAGPSPVTYNEAIQRIAAVVSVGATVPIP